MEQKRNVFFELWNSSDKRLKGGMVLMAFILIGQVFIPHKEQNQLQKSLIIKNEIGNRAANLDHTYAKSVFSSKLEAFTNLLLITEKKKNHFYEDNDGIAVGYGWNPTKNHKDFNLNVAKAMGLNTKEQKLIENISNTKDVQHVPSDLKKVIFSEKQLSASADIMMKAYEKEFLKVLKSKSKENNIDGIDYEARYNNLPYNQQAVLLHMTYKVGASRLKKYNDFFNKLFVYLNNPNEMNLNLVSQAFEYSYKNRQGLRVHDVRVEETHQKFFTDCLHYKDPVGFSKDKILSCRKMILEAKAEDMKTKNYIG